MINGHGERRGIEFTEHEGLRFKANAVEIYEGRERFDDFYAALYMHLAQQGGDVCMSVTDARLLAKYRKDPDLHRKRMKELADAGRITFRILAAQGNFTSAYVDYRRPALPTPPPPTSFFSCCRALAGGYVPITKLALHQFNPSTRLHMCLSPLALHVL